MREGRLTAYGDSETKERLRVEKVPGESLGQLLWLLRKLMDGKGVSQGGVAFIHLEFRKGGSGDSIRRLPWVQLPLLTPPLPTSLLGTHKM